MARNLVKQLQNGLVLWLDSNGKDLSGNGNNGTLVNAPVKQRVLQNDGLTYNGTSQYVSVPDATQLRLTTLTLSAWITISWTNSIEQNPIRKDTPWTRHLWGFTIPTWTNISAQVYNGTNYITTAHTLRVWVPTHATMVITGSSGTVSLYINWVLVGSPVVIWAFTAPTTQLTIGSAYDWTLVGNYFNWKIINPMLWNRALSAQEIQMLHKATFIV